MLSPALRYLRNDPAHAEGVGLLRRRNGETWEFFAGRITFVERNRAGRVIHMAGRALDGKARLKYLFLPELRKPVYGLARLDPSRPVFVVEGIFDYVTLWQRGLPGRGHVGHIDQGAGRAEAGMGREGGVRAGPRRSGRSGRRPVAGSHGAWGSASFLPQSRSSRLLSRVRI